MTCARYRALISRYLDDELTPRQRAELLAHIEHCASCAADLARYRRTELLLRKQPEGLTEHDPKRGSVRDIRRQGEARRRGLRWALAGRLRGRSVVAVCTLLVLVLLPLAYSGLSAPTGGQGISAKFGFQSPASPTKPSLDVPTTATPAGAASPPRLVETSPYDGAEGVTLDSSLLLTFDQPMDRHSVERAFHISPPAAGTFQWEADNQVRFRPSDPGLLQGATYSVAVTDGARSSVGAVVPPSTIWTFHTIPAPALGEVVPAPGADHVLPTAPLVLSFTQSMDPASVYLLLRRSDGDATRPLAGKAAWSPDRRTLRFTPDAPLPPGPLQVVAPDGRGAQGGALAPTAWSFVVAQPDNAVALQGPPVQTLIIGATDPEVAYTASLDPGDFATAGVGFALYPVTRGALETALPQMMGALEQGDAGPLAALVAGQAPARSWSATPQRGHAAGEPLSAGLPAHEPGLYVLTVRAGAGASDQRLVALGPEAMALFAADGRWAVWVNNVLTGLAVEGAQVRLYDRAGALLQAGTTDRNGLFMADPGGATPALALSEHAGAAALALPPRDAAAEAGRPSAATLDATILLDQAIYAPGDLISFAVAARAASVAQAGAPIRIALRDPADHGIGSLTLQPDSHGMVRGSFALAAGLQPGRYALVVWQEDKSRRRPLDVAPPAATAGAGDLAVTVRAPTGPLYSGELITASVRSTYAAPQSPQGLTATLTLAPESDAAPAGPAPVVLTATLDAKGQWDAVLRLPAESTDDGSSRVYRLTAAVSDRAGRAATAATLLTVLVGRLSLTQDLPARGFTPGATLVITSAAQDVAGRPAAGRRLTSALVMPGPDPAAGGAGAVLASVDAVTDAQGVATASLTLPLQGSFIVRSTITDSAGAGITTATPIWVYRAESGGGWAAYPAGSGQAILTADAGVYAPGDTARLLLQAADGDGLLLASLDGQTASAQVVQIRNGGALALVKIPAYIGAADALTVRFIRFSGAGVALSPASLRLPIKAPGQAILTAPSPEKEAFAPGERATVRLDARLDSGQPLSAGATLRLAPATPEAENAEADPFLAYSGDGAVSPAPAAAAPANYWNTALQLDPDGRGAVDLTLPETPGLWRLDAWVFTPAGAIRQSRILRVEAPLQAQWSLTDHLVEGDTSTVLAAVTNNQATSANVTARLQPPADDSIDLTAPVEQTFRLAPGETRQAVWTLRAGHAGGGDMTLDVAWGAPGAPGPAIHRTGAVQVQPYGLLDEQAHAGSVTDNETLSMTLPSDVDPTAAQLEVRGEPTLSGVLDDALDGLAPGTGPETPPGVAARLRATALTLGLFRAQGLNFDDLPEWASARTTLDLQDLYSAQRPDGGWPRDVAEGQSDVATTADTLQALWALSHGGTATDPTVTARGLDWLALHAESPLPVSGAAPQAPQPGDTPEALYTLALHGRAGRPAVDRLLAAEPYLSARGRSYLAMTLGLTGRAAEARLLLDRVGSDAEASGDAVALRALLVADPAGMRGPVVAVARGLLAARAGAGWGAPAATAEAIAALQQYALSVAETPPSGSYRLIVNGRLVREVTTGPAAPEGGRLFVTVPGAELHRGDNSVRFETAGGRLYYSLRALAVRATSERPLPTQRSESGDLGLLRVYEPGPDSTTVALTLTTTSALTTVRLNDPLPGGLTVLAGTVAEFTRIDESGKSAPAGRPVALGLTPGGVTADLGALPPGKYALTYTAHAQAVGSYTALPAFAAPDDPNVWARSGSNSFVLDR